MAQVYNGLYHVSTTLKSVNPLYFRWLVSLCEWMLYRVFLIQLCYFVITLPIEFRYFNTTSPAKNLRSLKREEVRCKMQDVRCRMQDVGCRMQDVRCRIQEVRSRSYEVRCVAMRVRCMMYDVCLKANCFTAKAPQQYCGQYAVLLQIIRSTAASNVQYYWR